MMMMAGQVLDGVHTIQVRMMMAGKVFVQKTRYAIQVRKLPKDIGYSSEHFSLDLMVYEIFV